MDAGKMLYDYRREHELTQVQAAEVLGIHPCYLCEIENGRKPGWKLEKKIINFVKNT